MVDEIPKEEEALFKFEIGKTAGTKAMSSISKLKPYFLMVVGIVLCLYLLTIGYKPSDLTTIGPQIATAVVVIMLAFSEKAGKT